jgi:TorA maturation chaperone TorD
MEPQSSVLSPQHSLPARQATYDLLARLYMAEPDAGLVSHLRGLPGFTDLLPEDAQLATWLEVEAIEYQWLFGMNVYPYESIFIDHDLMLNTQAADQVAALYRECAFDTQVADFESRNSKFKIQNSKFRNADPADHLGLEFGLMRHLLAVERRADASGDAAKTIQARRQQARFLHEHLARWAPILALTLERVARGPLHRLLATLTLEMVMEELALVERSEVGGRGSGTLASESLRPPAPDEQSINSVVRQLITPAEVGVFISRADINTLAGSLELPVQMGDRFQMLRGLFEAAGQFDLLPSLLDSLDALFTRSRDTLAQLAEGHPAWTPYALSWQERVSAGLLLVSDLQTQVSAEA